MISLSLLHVYLICGFIFVCFLYVAMIITISTPLEEIFLLAVSITVNENELEGYEPGPKALSFLYLAFLCVLVLFWPVYMAVYLSINK